MYQEESKELTIPEDFVFDILNLAYMRNVFLYKEERVTTSWHIAKDFNKEHKSVLRIINKMVDDLEEIDGLTCIPSYYNSSQNKKQPMYLLNKVGFEMVVLNFRSKKYTKLKEEETDIEEDNIGFSIKYISKLASVSPKTVKLWAEEAAYRKSKIIFYDDSSSSSFSFEDMIEIIRIGNETLAELLERISM